MRFCCLVGSFSKFLPFLRSQITLLFLREGSLPHRLSQISLSFSQVPFLSCPYQAVTSSFFSRFDHLPLQLHLTGPEVKPQQSLVLLSYIPRARYTLSTWSVLSNFFVCFPHPHPPRPSCAGKLRSTKGIVAHCRFPGPTPAVYDSVQRKQKHNSVASSQLIPIRSFFFFLSFLLI